MKQYYAVRYKGFLVGLRVLSGYPYCVADLMGAWILPVNEENKKRAEEYVSMFSGLELVILKVEEINVS